MPTIVLTWDGYEAPKELSEVQNTELRERKQAECEQKPRQRPEKDEPFRAHDQDRIVYRCSNESDELAHEKNGCVVTLLLPNPGQGSKERVLEH